MFLRFISFVCPSVFISVCLSIFFSVCLSTCVCLSVYPFLLSPLILIASELKHVIPSVVFGKEYGEFSSIKFKEIQWNSASAFLVADNRVVNGLSGRSLQSFDCTSIRLLSHFAGLCCAPHTWLAQYIHRLVHSPCSLPRGMVEIYEYMFMLKTCFMGMISLVVHSRDTPSMEYSLRLFQPLA